MIDQLTRLIRPLAQQARRAALLAIVTLVDDSTGVQQLQVKRLNGLVRGRVNRHQLYGFTSVPTAGAAGVVIAIGGSESNLVALGVDDPRYRPRSLQAGEVCIYSKFGQRITLKADGSIELASSVKVRVVSPLCEMSGDLNVAGNVSDASGSMQEMRDIYNPHSHGTSPPPSAQME